MSLVERVIKEAVENLLNSTMEKPSTFLKTFWRTSRANPVAVRADKNPTPTAATPPPKVTPSIIRPFLIMAFISPPIIPLSTIFAIKSGRLKLAIT